MTKRTLHSKKTSCPIANALDVIGDQWTLIIIRDMLFGNLHEYRDFLNSDEGISTNILSNRLKTLTSLGIIKSFPHPNDKKRKLYYLTKSGKELVYPLIEISKWSINFYSSKVETPDHIKELLINNPENLAQIVIAEIEKWEKEHVE